MGTQSAHLDQTPDLTPTVRTPQCGHTVRGTINKKKAAGTISFGGVLMQHAQATGFMQAYPQPNLMNLGDTISEWNPLFQRPPTQQRAE